MRRTGGPLKPRGARSVRRRRRRAAVSVVLSLVLFGMVGGVQSQVTQPRIEESVRLLVDRANAFRAGAGKRPLAVDDALTAAAANFARYMARTDRYGHEADGRSPARRAVAQGYDYCVILENIAYVQSSAGFGTAELTQRLITGWKDSPPHRHNLLDADVTQTGVGVAQSQTSRRFYAVQMFGRPKSAMLTFSIANQSDVAVPYELGKAAFELEPRTTRTHQQCRDERLRIQAVGPAGKGFETTPAQGSRYVVRGEQPGRLRVLSP